MDANRIKLGICEWSLPGGGLYGCKIASEAGLEGIQIDIGPRNRNYPLTHKKMQEAYLEAAEKWGITFPSLNVLELINIGMNNPKGSEEEKVSLDAIYKGIDAAKEMSIPLVMLPSFFKGEIKTDEDFYNTAECVKHACEYAGRKDIGIGYESTLSAEENLKMLEVVGSENLKLYYDSQNLFLLRGYDQAKIFSQLADYIVKEIHIKDGDGYMGGSLLGKGKSGFSKTIDEIKANDYSGWILLENNYDQEPLCGEGDNPYELLREDVNTLRDVLDL